MTKDEIDRTLILIYQSRNHAMWTNYTIPLERLKEFCKIKEAKEDLISTLRHLANNIENGDYDTK